MLKDIHIAIRKMDNPIAGIEMMYKSPFNPVGWGNKRNIMQYSRLAIIPIKRIVLRSILLWFGRQEEKGFVRISTCIPAIKTPSKNIEI